MTDAQRAALSRAIAESLGWRWDNQRFWISPEGLSQSDLPACTSSAMTVRLLSLMVVERGFVSLSAWISSPMRVCMTGQITDGLWVSDKPSTYAADDSIEESVALSFAKMRGLKGDWE